MKKFYLPLWSEQEYRFPLAFGFVPDLMFYLHEEPGPARPGVLVAPGGGYAFVSDSEAEMVALAFYRKGYNAFVCTYTTNLSLPVPLHSQPLQDLSRAVRLVRSRAAEFGTDPDRLAVCGFSAAGHLAGSLCVHFADVADPRPELAALSNRPSAALLCYPVITMGEKTHPGSRENLLGPDPDPAELRYFSLEDQVTPDTPPCFLWHTATDPCVPVENSYLFAAACLRAGVPFAHHVFSQGDHGLSLSNADWAAGRCGENRTAEQSLRLVRQIRAGKLAPTADALARAERFEDPEAWRRGLLDRHPVAEVAVWPDLADAWLRGLFG